MSVWRVLLPLAADDVPAVVPPGSTQDHLNYQFDLATTPAAGTLTGQATLRTEAEPVAVQPAPAPPPPVPRPDPPHRLASPEDLDSTWASRPMRVRPAAEPERALVTPAPAPSRVRAAAAAAPSRKPLWIAVAGAVPDPRRPEPLAGAAGRQGSRLAGTVSSGGSRAHRPPHRHPGARRPAGGPTSGTAGGEDSPLRRRRAPPGRSPPRSPSPAGPGAAPVPQEPMKAGDMIRRGQPNVEEPEVKTLASYAYPAAAKGSGRKVTIRLAVLVDESGQVIDAQIREGDKSGFASRRRPWRRRRRRGSSPPTRDGIAGRMWTELLLDFSE